MCKRQKRHTTIPTFRCNIFLKCQASLEPPVLLYIWVNMCNGEEVHFIKFTLCDFRWREGH